MKRVLIAEDELIVAKTYVMHLQRAGFEVAAQVSDAEVAVEKCRELQPDIVIMDVQLKNGTNGFEAAKKIRTFSDVPVIFTTGNSVSEAETVSAAIPNTSVLIKPVEPIQIEKAIRKILSES